MSSSSTFIWGPPGTGKTRTIGALIAALTRQGRSVLLVSHTNVAIDEAVIRTADALGDDLPDGEVLRLGAAYGPRLADRPRLLAETHVRERAVDLEEAISHAEAARTALRSKSLEAHRLVELSDWLESVELALRALERQERAVVRAERQLASAEHEADARQQRSPSGRSVRDRDLLGAQSGFRQARQRQHELVTEIIDVPLEHGLLEGGDADAEAAVRIAAAVALAREELSRSSLKDAKAEVDEASPRLAVLDRQIARYRSKMDHLGDDLIAEAQVVACTLTAAYLRNAVVARRFDTVIIDEVSIAPIPSAWFAANLATRAVVAVGDFRQLPPIALAETDPARRWLSRDVFEESGIRAAYEAGEAPSNLCALTTQHRMAPAICRLPNALSYKGLLVDGPGVDDEAELNEWFDPASGVTAPVSLVELAPARSWATSVRRGERTSRLNLLSAIATVDLVSSTLRADRPEPSDDGPSRALVISPYRPQAELLGALLRARGIDQEVTAGTIHAFQGSEASIVALDLTVAEPHYWAAIFDRRFEEAHRRMLNVAVTRARRRLVVVADRQFIRKHAADGTATRHLVRLLLGAREQSALEVIRVESSHAVIEVIRRAERYVAWWIEDADRDPEVTDHLIDLARRGVVVIVITQAGSSALVGMGRVM